MAILLMNSHAFGEIPIIVFYLFLLVFQITNNVFLVLNELNHVNPQKKLGGWVHSHRPSPQLVLGLASAISSTATSTVVIITWARAQKNQTLDSHVEIKMVRKISKNDEKSQSEFQTALQKTGRETPMNNRHVSHPSESMSPAITCQCCDVILAPDLMWQDGLDKGRTCVSGTCHHGSRLDTS
jgi:hypothetical protein